MCLNSKGFSLVELMVVLAIIGILASVSMPSYQLFIQQDRRALAQQQLMVCASGLVKYRIKYGRFEETLHGGKNSEGRSVCNTHVPIQGHVVHYLISLTDDSTADTFILKASAVSESAKDDGDLTLSYSGLGCRVTNDNACFEW